MFPDRGSGIDMFNEGRKKMEYLMRLAQGQVQGVHVESAAESNLQKLSDLHEAGILTDEEYETKKARLQSSV
jgi:hypothetical protein